MEIVLPKPESFIPAEVKPISPTLLYRRLLKLYIRKFDTDKKTIIAAWKQTRFEFWYHRNDTPEVAQLHNIRGQQIYEAIRAGLIPVYRDSKTNKTFLKYDSDTLKASHNHIDPVDAEEFIRRYHDKIPAEDVAEMQATLKKLGRWKGPNELRDEDLHHFKRKVTRKMKCTDPDD
ncbi:hypothetical protein TraAM80_04766 [Trypanosoma rangeli]|uniref:Uncharacterized protein n=1 Tax=Trypanosoma rangeli TaxID=5698 RepID=A0A422NHV0_TRYRA|nr:uncharacterized protein TraAM80_04766 [Trypanosoma rangeli]RNF05046.1 hypothetical protein TraAM80_04766 [Trypanosoma rangeli]|eukprot:RNF05046.1 hypothetical protein TraAM80_04766 [Trypanosoma rangeli]